MATARKYILAAKFQGAPKRSDLQIVEEKLPALNDGGEPQLYFRLGESRGRLVSRSRTVKRVIIVYYLCANFGRPAKAVHRKRYMYN